MSGAALRALAAQAGVAVQWTDAFGREQQVGDDTLRAMLAALQLPAGNDRQCAESLAGLRAPNGGARWPPLVTGTAGRPIPLPGALRAGARYRLRHEGGSVIEGRLEAGENSEPAGGARLPAQQTPGYHTLEAGGQCCVLAVAPQRCFSVADAVACRAAPVAGLPWGLAAQVYSLRRAGDGGLADFSAVESLAQAAARQGASALALSPLHAMFSAAPERFSPYGPSSRMFFNVLHIDPARVLGEAALRQAVDELPGCAQALEKLEATGLVDWPQAAGWRLRLLRALFGRWKTAPATQRESFTRFCEHGGRDLLDHARFEALDAWLRQQQAAGAGSDWRRWPQALRDPRGQAVQDFAQEHAESVDFHRFLQWQASLARERLQREAHNAGMAIGIIADLAVGADPGGSQAWGLQPAMLKGLSVGAPPDLLAHQGQDWGLGALSPRALREQGFAPWLSMLRANMAHSGGIRIDHILGLHRLWLVPEGAPSSAGAYLHFPLRDLLRLTALESLRHQAIVIGEDLGTVPPGFSQQLAEAGVLGIRALWFQREGQAFMPPRAWPASAMATTSTHDLCTVAGWWAGRDIERREALGLLGPQAGAADGARTEREADKVVLQAALQETQDAAIADGAAGAPPLGAVLAYVGSTPAPLVLAPLEDVLGIVEQPNLPGTVEGHPNWRQRLPQDAAALLEAPEARQRLARLAAARRDAAALPARAEPAA
jgi:4-alpha-glucanotransferase